MKVKLQRYRTSDFRDDEFPCVVPDDKGGLYRVADLAPLLRLWEAVAELKKAMTMPVIPPGDWTTKLSGVFDALAAVPTEEEETK